MSAPEEPYIVIEKRGSSLGAFLWGAVAGAVTALLFAPRSGEETQEELREKSRRLRDQAEEKFAELRGSVEQTVEKARSDVAERVERARSEMDERRHQAEEALRAGKEAARRARGDLERRVSESKAAYRASVEDRDAEEEGRATAGSAAAGNGDESGSPAD